MRRTGSARAVLFTAIMALAPVVASAVTVEEIVALSKAGVSEPVILALLERDHSILTIAPDQIVRLKREGLSDTLIVAMLRNGRAEGEEAAQAVADAKAASILATLPISAYTPAPDLVIVGHGPDRPNTSYGNSTFYSPSAGYSVRRGFGASSYSGYSGLSSLDAFTPFYSGPSKRFHGAINLPRGDRMVEDHARGDRLLCVARVDTPRGPGPSYVTECPPVMQPHGR